MDKKSRNILKGIAAGRSYEQILAADDTLTYHDIFHVVTEAPTSFWRNPAARKTGKGAPPEATPLFYHVVHRTD